MPQNQTSLRQRLVRAMPWAIGMLLVISLLALSYQARWAIRLSGWSWGVVTLLASLYAFMLWQRAETLRDLTQLRVQSRRQVYQSVLLAWLFFYVGFFLLVGLHWMMDDAPPAKLKLEDVGLGFGIVIWSLIAVAAAFRVYGFRVGPVFVSAKGFSGRTRLWGCSLNALIALLLAIGAAILPAPTLIPAFLMFAYVFLLGRAGVINAGLPERPINSSQELMCEALPLVLALEAEGFFHRADELRSAAQDGHAHEVAALCSPGRLEDIRLESTEPATWWHKVRTLRETALRLGESSDPSSE